MLPLINKGMRILCVRIYHIDAGGARRDNPRASMSHIRGVRKSSYTCRDAAGGNGLRVDGDNACEMRGAVLRVESSSFDVRG